MRTWLLIGAVIAASMVIGTIADKDPHIAGVVGLLLILGALALDDLVRWVRCQVRHWAENRR